MKKSKTPNPKNQNPERGLVVQDANLHDVARTMTPPQKQRILLRASAQLLAEQNTKEQEQLRSDAERCDTEATQVALKQLPEAVRRWLASLDPRMVDQAVGTRYIAGKDVIRLCLNIAIPVSAEASELHRQACLLRSQSRELTTDPEALFKQLQLADLNKPAVVEQLVKDVEVSKMLLKNAKLLLGL